MKSFILAAIMSTVFAAKSEAQNVPVSIRHSFSASFPFASQTKWTSTGKLYKAEFIQDNEKQFAFINNLGDLIAVSRFIEFANLPHIQKIYLMKDFPDHNIVELIEVKSENDTDYYATLERNGISFTVKSWEGRRWKLFPGN